MPFLEAVKSFFIARFGLIRGEVSLAQRVEISDEGIRDKRRAIKLFKSSLVVA